jgi:DNA-binding NarL/FixJ family response regulator
MIRILLADDHDVMRSGLRTILEAHGEWQVCGEAKGGHEAVHLALELKPDIAVIDIAMPGLDGLEVTRQIKKELPLTEVLIFTMHETENLIRAVIAAGARG